MLLLARPSVVCSRWQFDFLDLTDKAVLFLLFLKKSSVNPPTFMFPQRLCYVGVVVDPAWRRA